MARRPLLVLAIWVSGGQGTTFWDWSPDPPQGARAPLFVSAPWVRFAGISAVTGTIRRSSGVWRVSRGRGRVATGLTNGLPAGVWRWSYSPYSAACRPNPASTYRTQNGLGSSTPSDGDSGLPAQASNAYRQDP